MVRDGLKFGQGLERGRLRKVGGHWDCSRKSRVIRHQMEGVQRRQLGGLIRQNRGTWECEEASCGEADTSAEVEAQLPRLRGISFLSCLRLSKEKETSGEWQSRECASVLSCYPHQSYPHPCISSQSMRNWMRTEGGHRNAATSESNLLL